MRITTQMMNRNSLYNINKNKADMDHLNNMLGLEKKITRPSDDPVVAIRGLKLRSTVSELTQYYDRNTEDANAWLDVTQGAIDSCSDILTAMKAQFTSGATGTQSTNSRSAIADELKALVNQLYENGNIDYAGRNIFTGFKSDVNLTFSEADLKNQIVSYQNITEEFTGDDIQDVELVYGDVTNKEETMVGTLTVSRIRLAYDKLDANGGYSISGMTLNKMSQKDFQAMLSTSVDKQAAQAKINGSSPIYLYETGEIILGSADADALRVPGVTTEVTYDKKQWSAGDLRPEHYFGCVQIVESAGGAQIRREYSLDDTEQAIIYDLSENQSMQINTNAKDVFLHAIGRDISEILTAIEDTNDIEKAYNKAKAAYEANPEDADAKKEFAAAEKKYSLTKDMLQKKFESNLTSFTSYIHTVTLAGTVAGTRVNRVELIQNRLMDLKTNSKELASINEDADLSQLSIDVAESQLTYQAALMATGQISQSTLLSYI